MASSQLSLGIAYLQPIATFTHLPDPNYPPFSDHKSNELLVCFPCPHPTYPKICLHYCFYLRLVIITDPQLLPMVLYSILCFILVMSLGARRKGWPLCSLHEFVYATVGLASLRLFYHEILGFLIQEGGWGISQVGIES